MLRKILNAHSKTATEAFYLELGIWPLRFVLSTRRLMYLWHLLHRDKSELISKVYFAQKSECNRGDWCQQIKEEKQKYQIMETDEDIRI